jgi:hypothetical protein
LPGRFGVDDISPELLLPELLLDVRRQLLGFVNDHAAVGGGRLLCFQAFDELPMFAAAIVSRHDDDDRVVVERKSTRVTQVDLPAEGGGRDQPPHICTVSESGACLGRAGGLLW